MKLRNVIETIDYIELVNCDDTSIEFDGISYNSRNTNPNDIFVCLMGEHVDGHEYAEEAIDNGAIACIVERRLNLDVPQIVVPSTEEMLAKISSEYYGNPSRKVNIIGVTGTNGKTTVTHLIQKIYEAFDQKCVLIGTLGYKFKSENEMYHGTAHTTPQAPELQRLLFYANERCHDNVVMEVSSHSLVQHRVDYVDFNGAVFTNLTQDHLDFHITMENYFRAKAILFENLVAGDFAVINADDDYAEKFLEVISPSVKVVTYGIKKPADIVAKDVEYTEKGASFTCIIDNKEYKTTTAMNGLFSVYNILAALATGIAIGFDAEKTIHVLEKIKGVAGRFEIIVTNPTVIVDYAHTPDGLRNVLATAREITPIDGKLICVFGCGGDRDTTKRPKMGAIAEELADNVIITSDNPRFENPMDIINFPYY